MFKHYRRVLIQLAAACLVLWAVTATAWRAGQGQNPPAPQAKDQTFSGGVSNGLFDWQFPGKGEEYGYDEEEMVGRLPQGFRPCQVPTCPTGSLAPSPNMPGNPIMEPTPGSWDRGHYGGGVHNGSVLVVDGQFCYVYRGERELDRKPGYICDIGLATSKDGIHFTKDTAHSPFFGKGKDKDFSFEDVCLVRIKGTYYLFCNVWDWTRAEDPKASGAFLATSKDMVHWTKRGLIFPHASEIHRNPVVLQTPDNEAVKANGKFVMYLDYGLVAYSDDLIHWTSKKVANPWPGEKIASPWRIGTRSTRTTSCSSPPAPTQDISTAWEKSCLTAMIRRKRSNGCPGRYSALRRNIPGRMARPQSRPTGPFQCSMTPSSLPASPGMMANGGCTTAAANTILPRHRACGHDEVTRETSQADQCSFCQ